MRKAKLTTHKEMEAEKIREDMAMTPKQRLMLALQLMETAIALSPDKTLHSQDDGGIKWIELKPKDGKAH